MVRGSTCGATGDIGSRGNTNLTLGMEMGHTITVHPGTRVASGRQGAFRPSDHHHHLPTYLIRQSNRRRKLLPPLPLDKHIDPYESL